MSFCVFVLICRFEKSFFVSPYTNVCPDDDDFHTNLSTDNPYNYPD